MQANRKVFNPLSESASSIRQLENAEWVAQALRISESTLAKWRMTNIGPPFFKMNGRVVYDRRDIDAYVESCRVQTISSADGA